MFFYFDFRKSENGIGRLKSYRLVMAVTSETLIVTALFLFSALYTEAAVRQTERKTVYAREIDAGELAEIYCDTSMTGKGVVRVDVGADGKFAVILMHEGQVYSYVNLPAGEVFLPLNMGNGRYDMITAQRLSGTKHRVLERYSFAANFPDEMTPFLTANYMVNYTENAAFSGVAHALQGTGDEMTVMGAVCDWVWMNITYDKGKEQILLGNEMSLSQNMSAPDETYMSRRGICLDMAVLAVAMLRMDDIPTRLVFGMYGGRYHAWAQAFSNVNGWITVDPVNHYVGAGSEYSAQRMY